MEVDAVISRVGRQRAGPPACPQNPGGEEGGGGGGGAARAAPAPRFPPACFPLRPHRGMLPLHAETLQDEEKGGFEKFQDFCTNRQSCPVCLAALLRADN